MLVRRNQSRLHRGTPAAMRMKANLPPGLPPAGSQGPEDALFWCSQPAPTSLLLDPRGRCPRAAARCHRAAGMGQGRGDPWLGVRGVGAPGLPAPSLLRAQRSPCGGVFVAKMKALGSVGSRTSSPGCPGALAPHIPALCLRRSPGAPPTPPAPAPCISPPAPPQRCGMPTGRPPGGDYL